MKAIPANVVWNAPDAVPVAIVIAGPLIDDTTTLGTAADSVVCYQPWRTIRDARTLWAYRRCRQTTGWCWFPLLRLLRREPLRLGSIGMSAKVMQAL